MRFQRCRRICDVHSCLSYAFLFILVCGFSGEFIEASNWTPNKFPNPLNNAVSCGRHRNVSLVCDPDGAMSDISADTVDEALGRAHNNTSCICHSANQCSGWGGFRIGVVVIKDIKESYMSSFRTTDRAYNDFAKSIRRQWFRDIGCDDSLLVLVVTDHDQIYISVGGGTRQKLTLNEVRAVCMGSLPYIKQKKYEQGLLHVLNAIVKNINDTFTAAVETVMMCAIFGGIFLLICGVFVFCYRSGRLGGENVMKFPLGAPMGFQRHRRLGKPKMVGHGRHGRRLTIFVCNNPRNNRRTGISWL